MKNRYNDTNSEQEIRIKSGSIIKLIISDQKQGYSIEANSE
jgi:hypothetical protein